MSDPLDILCAGRIYCDLVFSGLSRDPAPGQEVFADGLAITAGGGAHITACYTAALGLRSGLIGVLPAAPFDAVVRDELGANGVVAHLAAAAPGDDPQVTVAIVRGGDRAFLTRRPGAALPDPLVLPPARHLHVGELRTALDCPALVPAARRAGMTVSLDCSWDEEAFADPDAAAIIAAVDVFLPNAEEHERLTELGIAMAPRAVTVVKKGAAGATAIPRDGDPQTVAATPVRVLDTTGAGDAFNAGFLHGWLSGRPADACLALGHRCGAVAVGRFGGAGELPAIDPDLDALTR